MSLLNDVLRDLDARRARADASDARSLDGLAPAPPRQRAEARRGALLAVLALAGGAFAVAWLGGWIRVAPGPEAGATRGAPLEAAEAGALPNPGLALHGLPAARPVPRAPTAAAKSVAPPAAAAASRAPARAAATAVPAAGRESSATDSGAPSDGTTLATAERVGPPLPAALAPSDAPPDDAEAPGSIEKRALPPSAAELAERAYREGLRLERRERFAAAQAHFERALHEAPDHRGARIALAVLYVRSKRLAEARTLLTQGLGRAPHDAELAQLLARVDLELGQASAAVEVLEDAVPMEARNPSYRALLAALYAQVGQPAEAADSYARALRAAPSHPAWWMGLGIALEHAGHPQEAALAYRHALDPTIAPAGAALAPDVARWVTGRLHALEGAARPAS